MKYTCTKFPEKTELTAVLEKQEPTESIAKMVHFYLPMVGGSLRILRLIPLLKLVESAVKTPKIKSNQINKCINTKMHHFCNTLSWFLLFQNSCVYIFVSVFIFKLPE
jgi:hypothetical protein